MNLQLFLKIYTLPCTCIDFELLFCSLQEFFLWLTGKCGLGAVNLTNMWLIQDSVFIEV